MSDVTRLIEAAQNGDRQAAAALLPLVYEELRRLAANLMASENSGQTLDATALVHEAYLRLVGDRQFNGRGHFFVSAAISMRRILVDIARSKAAEKAGGGVKRLDFERLRLAEFASPPELLALDEALSELQKHDPRAAELVNLRFFAGLTHQEAAAALGIGRREADRMWALARAWLYRQLAHD